MSSLWKLALRMAIADCSYKHFPTTAKRSAPCFLPCLSALWCLDLSSQTGPTSRYLCQKSSLREKTVVFFFSLPEMLSFSSVTSRDVTSWCTLPFLCRHWLLTGCHLLPESQGIIFWKLECFLMKGVLEIYLIVYSNSVRNSVSDHLFH